ncbi:hypothetical protein [Bacillus sp. 7894-2]|uniref:hypothetical protein n=1 Tax=Bacillus sp. 7894-2 TaxID=2021695 RepID=UPI000BA64AF5|nr:hypothetical protein [Bacillus sp. 7894-2]PAE24017.1 hypothetical protein CHI10_14525 [Bacillus sp. 7894-2]
MKKVFIVEVEYEELPENVERDAHVFNETALECAIEDLMFGYHQYKSIIQGNYEVNVRQIEGDGA